MAVHYREIEPSPALRPWVECFWVNTSDVPPSAPAVHKVVPDGCADIILDLGDPPLGSAAGLHAVGTMTRPLLVRRVGHVEFVGVRFHPGRARPFLGVPLDEVTDERVPLIDLSLAGTATLLRRLHDAATPDGRIAILDAALARRLATTERLPDAWLLAAVDRLRARPSTPTVAELASDLNVSRQHLTRVFRHEVGVPPQRFVRIVRFRRALEAARRHADPDWLGIALDAGYYDQSHLIGDFKEMAGVTPGELVACREQASSDARRGTPAR